MPTVRADFFLDPATRLTEQERALMTAMLADLVASVADELRAAAELRSISPDGGQGVFERLMPSGLLDLPDLVALLLCRAEQERVAATIGARHAGGSASFLHMLAASDDADISAAAMAVILGRSRRRDRFDAPRVALDDLPADCAGRLVHAVAAAIHGEAGAQAAPRLAEAAAAVLDRHDEGKRMEALAFVLVHALDHAGQLDEGSLRSALADGELAILAEALARRAGVGVDTAWSQMTAGGQAFACLLRMAAVPRALAAEIAAATGEMSAVGPAELIGLFDALTDPDVERAREWLRLDRQYRDSLESLGGRGGDFAD